MLFYDILNDTRPEHEKDHIAKTISRGNAMSELSIKTHDRIDRRLCGNPLLLEEGICTVALRLSDQMRADASGLVHGGFIFGLADYAAMLAVNHPNVVLAKAEVSFLKPACTGDLLTATARISVSDEKKRTVTVEILRGDEKVFSGTFLCIVPERHVLAGAP